MDQPKTTPQSLITCCWWGRLTKGGYKDITFFARREEWGPNEKWHVYIFFFFSHCTNKPLQAPGPWRLALTFFHINSYWFLLLSHLFALTHTYATCTLLLPMCHTFKLRHRCLEMKCKGRGGTCRRSVSSEMWCCDIQTEPEVLPCQLWMLIAKSWIEFQLSPSSKLSILSP